MSAEGMLGELMAQFEATLDELSQDPSIDPQTRELLRSQFSEAVADLGTMAGAPAEIPGRAVWVDAVQALQASGSVAESEVNDLIRQVNHALEPLERRESQVAIEFGRRLQTEGEEAALAWFRTQSQRAKDAEAHQRQATVPPSAAATPLRNDVIKSRSNRLRGPPR